VGIRGFLVVLTFTGLLALPVAARAGLTPRFIPSASLMFPLGGSTSPARSL